MFAEGEERAVLTTSYSFLYDSKTLGESARGLRRIIDLGTGKTVAALQRIREPLMQPCSYRVYSFDNAFHVMMSTETDERELKIVKGTWEISYGRWLWQKPPRLADARDKYCSTLEFRNGGRTFFLCPQTISASLVPGSSDVSLLDDVEDGYMVESGAEDADLAIWAERKSFENGSRIRAWAPDGRGLRTVISDLPWRTWAVGLDRARIVGAARGVDGLPGAIAVWFAPRVLEKEPKVTLGPVMAGLVGLPQKIKSADDFISVEVFNGNESGPRDTSLILIRTSDWSKRWFGSVGEQLPIDHTLTSEYLYVTYSGWGANWGKDANSVYRYDLSKFDSIGVPFN
ncbi:hypothetical protein [Vulgatibacter incomptus]|uniref:hypothetical protein n=1 Tax=Vulgatibacter incomptus TaxID=1391653 RepID=UPI0012FA0E28|nr:hypothetical protein [Vulgatibacter incomptus]